MSNVLIIIIDYNAAAIKDVQKLLDKKKPKIAMDVVEIQQYYKGTADTITKLETKGLSLAETVELWEDAILHLCHTSPSYCHQNRICFK